MTKPYAIFFSLILVVIAVGSDYPEFEARNGETNLEAINGRYTVQIFSPAHRPQIEATRNLEAKFVSDLGLPQEQLTRMIDTLSASGYRIVLTPSDECNPYLEDYIDQQNYLDQILEQVKEAAEFLSEYHVALFGKNFALYKIRQIEICTVPRSSHYRQMLYDFINKRVTLKVGPLQVGPVPVPRFRRDNLNPLTRAEIRQLWNAGEPHKTDGNLLAQLLDTEENPVRGYWTFINPISEPRNILREVAKRFAFERYRELIPTNPTFTEQNLLAKLDSRWSAALANALGSASDRSELFNRVLGQWRTELSSEQTPERAALAGITAVLRRREVYQQEQNIQRRQFGFVNVENFHNIEVTTSAQEVAAFEDVIIVPQSLVIDITQIGLVNVSTTDNVRITTTLPRLLNSEVIDRGTLTNALRALGITP